MNKLKLSQIENRISEIKQTQELCDPDRDSDVLDNLDLELDSLVKTLEKAKTMGELVQLKIEHGPKDEGEAIRLHLSNLVATFGHAALVEVLKVEYGIGAVTKKTRKVS